MPKPESRAVSVLLTGLVALGPISTDLYLPALPSIGAAFQADPGATQLTLSVFMIGLALGMLAYGPLSDRFGRRPLILGGTVVFVIASIGCALATSLDMLIALRFFQALGACCGPVLGRAVVRDVYPPAGAAKVLAYLAVAMGVAPALGPIIGGLLTEWASWRATFWVLALVGVAVGVGAAVLLMETNRYKDPTATQPLRLAANYAELLRNRSYVAYVVVAACGLSGIFSFISGSSFVLIDAVGLSPSAFGLCFSAVVVGFMTGSFTSGRTVSRFGIDRLIRIGTVTSLTGAVAMMAAAQLGPPTIATVVGPMVLFMIGVGFTLPNAMAGAMQPFPHMAGTASALLGFSQMSLAALVGMAVGHWTDGTAVPMATALIAAALTATVAYRFGVKAGDTATEPSGSA